MARAPAYLMPSAASKIVSKCGSNWRVDERAHERKDGRTTDEQTYGRGGLAVDVSKYRHFCCLPPSRPRLLLLSVGLIDRRGYEESTDEGCKVETEGGGRTPNEGGGEFTVNDNVLLSRPLRKVQTPNGRPPALPHYI